MCALLPPLPLPLTLPQTEITDYDALSQRLVALGMTPLVGSGAVRARDSLPVLADGRVLGYVTQAFLADFELGSAPPFLYILSSPIPRSHLQVFVLSRSSPAARSRG